MIPERRWVLALAALSLSAFAFVTTETVPIGLLPQIAASLGTSIPLTGSLVSTYAFTVALFAVPATALTGALPRRRLLLILLATLLLSNLCAAVASSFAVLFAARVCNAIAHGVFWSVVSSCAVRLVPERRRGVALAILFSGPSLAIVGGVPLATFIGQRFGWHAAFGAVAATATVVLGILAIALHDETTARAQPGTARSLVRSGPFRSLLVTTVLVVLGQFVAYTYVVPYVERIGGFPADAAAPLLLLFGLAGALGNLTAGMIAQRRPAAASLVTTASIVVALLVLCVAGVNRAETIAALGLWGWGSGGLAVGLQTRVLALAPDAPDLASALFSGSFNIGIGGGALLGGVIYAGFGLARIAGAGAALAICALLVQCVSIASERNRARSACAG